MEDANQAPTSSQQELETPEPSREQPFELFPSQHTDKSPAPGEKVFCFPADAPRFMCLESGMQRAQELLLLAADWSLVEFKQGSVMNWGTAAWQSCSAQSLDQAAVVTIEGNEQHLLRFSEAQLYTTWRARTEEISGCFNLRPGVVSGSIVEVQQGGAAFNVFGALPMSRGRHAFEFVAYDGLQSTEVFSCGLVSVPFSPADKLAGELGPAGSSDALAWRFSSWNPASGDGRFAVLFPQGAEESSEVCTVACDAPDETGVATLGFVVDFEKRMLSFFLVNFFLSMQRIPCFCRVCACKVNANCWCAVVGCLCINPLALHWLMSRIGSWSPNARSCNTSRSSTCMHESFPASIKPAGLKCSPGMEW